MKFKLTWAQSRNGSFVLLVVCFLFAGLTGSMKIHQIKAEAFEQGVLAGVQSAVELSIEQEKGQLHIDRTNRAQLLLERTYQKCPWAKP